MIRYIKAQCIKKDYVVSQDRLPTYMRLLFVFFLFNDIANTGGTLVIFFGKQFR